jgi:hypothetical protein
MPDRHNYCGFPHGGMCRPISALMSILEYTNSTDLKYFTIKQCESLFTEVSRLTFPPGTGKPVVDAPGEVIKKGDTTQEIIYICQFIKINYKFGSYPGITLTVQKDDQVSYDLSSKDLDFFQIIPGSSRVLIKMNKVDDPEIIKSFNFLGVSMSMIIQSCLLQILKTNGISLRDIPEDLEQLTTPHVSFGVKNKLKKVEAEIKYLKSFIQCV